MNFASLAIGFAFIAIAMPFLAKAKTEADPTQKRNKKIAGILFLLAGAAFLVAFAMSALNR